MNILLTDRLTCPRCGPEWGLVFLAEEVVDRRIFQGEFGCANCESRFMVRGGFGDLRIPEAVGASREDPVPPSADAEPYAEPETDPEAAVQMAALLGITSGPGMVLIRGRRADNAQALAELVPDIEVVAAHESQEGQPEARGVSRMNVGTPMPFRSLGFQGVVLSPGAAPDEVREGMRITAPMGRVVVFRASEAEKDLMEEGGFRIVLWQDGVLVGQRERLPAAGVGF
jgi:hypothetical protein